MDVVRSLSDRIVVLHQGKLVADGKPAEVIASDIVREAFLSAEDDNFFSHGGIDYKSVIRALYLQPTLAVKLAKYVQLGAGFDLNFFHVQLRRRVDLGDREAGGVGDGGGPGAVATG